MQRFREGTASAAKKYEAKGHKVVYHKLTTQNMKNAMADKDAAEIYTLSHIFTAPNYPETGSLKAYNGGYVSGGDLEASDKVELYSAGCKSDKLVPSQFSGKFKFIDGLNADKVMSDKALVDLNEKAEYNSQFINDISAKKDE